MSHLMSSNRGFKQGDGKVDNGQNTSYIEKSKVHLFEKLFKEIVAKVGSQEKAFKKMKTTRDLAASFREKKISANRAKLIIDAHNRIVKGIFAGRKL